MANVTRKILPGQLLHENVSLPVILKCQESVGTGLIRRFDECQTLHHKLHRHQNIEIKSQLGYQFSNFCQIFPKTVRCCPFCISILANTHIIYYHTVGGTFCQLLTFSLWLVGENTNNFFGLDRFRFWSLGLRY